MLNRLSIRNYLLIEELDLDLRKGLTAITGETGSGKSILIGALGLAMGDRVEGQVARDAGQKCVVEVEVSLKRAAWEAWFKSAELPFETNAILRRQIESGGRSRAFINDTPVKLEQLRELTGRLVHVHSQHQSLLLQDRAFQLELLDHHAGLQKDASACEDSYAQWHRAHRTLEQLKTEEATAQAELDYVKFQSEELEAAKLNDGELAKAEQSLLRAENAEGTLKALRNVEAAVIEEGGAVGSVSQARSLLQKLAPNDAELHALLLRLDSVRVELQDIADEVARLADHVQMDPAEVVRLSERIDLINRLLRKHRAQDEAALIALRDSLSERCTSINSMGDRIAGLEKEEQALKTRLKESAERLSSARRKAMPELARKVSGMLHELGMPHAVFVFEHSVVEPGPTGVDRIRACFSANKDRAPEPLERAASGGEVSRVMLALLTLSAESIGLPTIVFDEIDTGVSGETADRIGTLMARMGKQRQVIAITHLPQIASKADEHLLVTKTMDDKGTHTQMRFLDEEERVMAVAQMLSGRKTSAAALENARVLLKGR
ncbi:MAG: DNA repair protein RecN [Flavobacteriales bacterium]|nr:DNA repair protein RecN [Flavobacteriales bacterium]